MNESISLREHLQRKTLPRVTMVALVSMCVLLVFSTWSVREQLSLKHKTIEEQFKEDFATSIRLIDQQVRNLANNDLIINSIVDFESRDDYLPVYFRSLELTTTGDFGIAMTDFSGSIVVGKNTKIVEKHSWKFDWIYQVLDSGKSYINMTSVGIFISHPVKYWDNAEGAIVFFTPSFQDIIQHHSSGELQILLDNNDVVLYSSNKSLADVGNQINWGGFRNWYKRKSVLGEFNVVSLESYQSAYSKVLWLIIILLVALAAIILGSVYSVKVSSKMASELFLNFDALIEEMKSKKDFSSSSTEVNGPTELRNLGNSYRDLLSSLANTTVSKEKFESVLALLKEMILLLDYNGDVQIKNAALVEFEAILSDTALDKWHAFLKKMMANREETNLELELNLEQELTEREHEFKITLWRIKSFNFKSETGWLLVGNDITEERNLQKDLLVRNQAIEEAQTSIVISDARHPENPIIYANRAFYKLTGYEEIETIGKNCRFLQGEETEVESVEKIRMALISKEPITVKLTNYKKNGEKFINELSITPVFDDSFEITHFLGIQSDITEREMAASLLLEAREKAESSARLKSEFLASMSHEIRTPMNGIIGMLTLLGSSHLDEQQKHRVSLALGSAKGLLTLLNDILDFSKVEAGKLELEKVDFDLRYLMGELCESVASQAQEKGVELVLDLTGVDESLVVGDPGRVRQIAFNLIGNAVKFTSKGEILVKVELEKEATNHLLLALTVKDSGIGIPENKLETLFESFTQVDSSTTRQFGGTGLGLSIVKQLTELMGGTVTVSSESQVGSEFVVTLHLEKSVNSELVEAPGGLKGAHILVIAKNNCFRQAFCKQLMKWEAKVTGVKDLNRAQLVAKRRQESGLDPLNYVFVDSDTLELEEGYQLVSNPQFISGKLVFITNVRTLLEDQTLALYGFDHQFPKPVTTRDLFTSFGETDIQAKPSDSKGSDSHPSEYEANLLLVDDNEINQLVAVGIIEEIPGVKVSVAINGQDAIEKLHATESDVELRYQLVLMDCQMPVMDGYEATRRIRSGEAGICNKDIPIVAMTAHAMQGDRELCLSVGMNDYLAKPIEPELVEKCIKAHLRNELAF